MFILKQTELRQTKQAAGPVVVAWIGLIPVDTRDFELIRSGTIERCGLVGGSVSLWGHRLGGLLCWSYAQCGTRCLWRRRTLSSFSSALSAVCRHAALHTMMTTDWLSETVSQFQLNVCPYKRSLGPFTAIKLWELVPGLGYCCDSLPCFYLEECGFWNFGLGKQWIALSTA